MRLAKTLNATLFAAFLLVALAAAPAQGAFGLKDIEVTSTGEDGSLAVGAGSHPFAITTSLAVETEIDPDSGKVVPVEEAKNLNISFPPGIVGNPTAVPQCPAAEFLAGEKGECSDASAVGYATIEFGEPGKTATVPVYNLIPSPGVAARLGFIVEARAPVVIDVGLNTELPANVIARTSNISQALFFLSAEVEVWGVPAAEAHDDKRGSCALIPKPGGCPVNVPEKPFLTLPVSCSAPLTFGFEADSWQKPGIWFETPASVGGSETPLSPTGCAKLDFTPLIAARPTTTAASSGSGLDFDIEFDDPGLTSATGISQATIKKAVVTLPEGVTLNPSIAEGLATCSSADLARETPFSAPGVGCPEASKVGNVEVETPLLEGKLVKGSIYVASQNENPFGTLIALYMVIKDPGLGILVKLPGKVTPDPKTGQLVTTFGEPGYEVPQVPFSRFRFHFRAGDRAPLITPPNCGTHTTTAVLTPSSGAAPLTATTSFKTTSGVGGGPCPAGGIPPFSPGFEAGSINNGASAYSPFYMRLTRGDGQQGMTRFSAVLPPGVTGKIAGLDKCAQGAVDAARAKTGRAELASPSCPASSRIGRTMAGAGVGEALTYVPGSLYLAGPYKGAPLSVAALVPAVAGPYDVGTVVVQVGLRLNPITAQVEVDGASSDPIPHILAGIPLNVRDLRVYTDRPEFTLNPTSCEEEQTRASLFGSYADVFNPADDVPVALSHRYQAADCASLPFAPRLALKLKGGSTKRGGHPAFEALYRPRAGNANTEGIVVRLPRSAFLDQAHIRTICTRVQFAADACPPGSIYGRITAHTPLLDEPLQGPVYLRSSNHNLPDLVFDLHGIVDIEVSARIDSKNGGIRATLEGIPDAPISKTVLRMQGAKKGLIVNSRNLCAAKSKAAVQMSGQNGKRSKAKPVLMASCGKQGRSKRER